MEGPDTNQIFARLRQIASKYSDVALVDHAEKALAEGDISEAQNALVKVEVAIYKTPKGPGSREQASKFMELMTNGLDRANEQKLDAKQTLASISKNMESYEHAQFYPDHLSALKTVAATIRDDNYSPGAAQEHAPALDAIKKARDELLTAHKEHAEKAFVDEDLVEEHLEGFQKKYADLLTEDKPAKTSRATESAERLFDRLKLISEGHSPADKLAATKESFGKGRLLEALEHMESVEADLKKSSAYKRETTREADLDVLAVIRQSMKDSIKDGYSTADAGKRLVERVNSHEQAGFYEQHLKAIHTAAERIQQNVHPDAAEAHGRAVKHLENAQEHLLRQQEANIRNAYGSDKATADRQVAKKWEQQKPRLINQGKELYMKHRMTGGK